MSAAELYQMAFGQPHPAVKPHPTEHPVRCAATLEGPFLDLGSGGKHVHACIHPAKVPEGVVGVLEHLCECGCSWSQTEASE